MMNGRFMDPCFAMNGDKDFYAAENCVFQMWGLTYQHGGFHQNRNGYVSLTLLGTSQLHLTSFRVEVISLFDVFPCF